MIPSNIHMSIDKDKTITELIALLFPVAKSKGGPGSGGAREGAGRPKGSGSDATSSERTSRGVIAANIDFLDSVHSTPTE